MLTKKRVTEKDVNLVLEIWEKSVRETHDFLAEADILFYKEMIPKHLKFIEVELWYKNSDVVGFTGVSGTELGMLFLDPSFIGQKYGSYILLELIKTKHIKTIDVNSQNLVAKEFYLRHGFEVVAEDQVDGFGKPYPITHLAINN